MFFWQDLTAIVSKSVFVHLVKQGTALSQSCQGQSAKPANTVFQIAFENSCHTGGHYLGFQLALCSGAWAKFLFG